MWMAPGCCCVSDCGEVCSSEPPTDIQATFSYFGRVFVLTKADAFPGCSCLGPDPVCAEDECCWYYAGSAYNFYWCIKIRMYKSGDTWYITVERYQFDNGSSCFEMGYGLWVASQGSKWDCANLNVTATVGAFSVELVAL